MVIPFSLRPLIASKTSPTNIGYEGPDLVLYYKYLLFLKDDSKYEYHFNGSDSLSLSQKKYAENHFKLFEKWWKNWEGKHH
jgi:1-pyrroline-4-hydroxy-2-carboxylate deaminase